MVSWGSSYKVLWKSKWFHYYRCIICSFKEALLGISLQETLSPNRSYLSTTSIIYCFFPVYLAELSGWLIIPRIAPEVYFKNFCHCWCFYPSCDLNYQLHAVVSSSAIPHLRSFFQSSWINTIRYLSLTPFTLLLCSKVSFIRSFHSLPSPFIVLPAGPWPDTISCLVQHALSHLSFMKSDSHNMRLYNCLRCEFLYRFNVIDKCYPQLIKYFTEHPQVFLWMRYILVELLC